MPLEASRGCARTRKYTHSLPGLGLEVLIYIHSNEFCKKENVHEGRDIIMVLVLNLDLLVVQTPNVTS